jgi:hypothetical protein
MGRPDVMTYPKKRPASGGTNAERPWKEKKEKGEAARAIYSDAARDVWRSESTAQMLHVPA